MMMEGQRKNRKGSRTSINPQTAWNYYTTEIDDFLVALRLWYTPCM